MPSRYRLNLSHEPVRALLSEYKILKNIPQSNGLTEKQRDDFEVYAIIEGRKRDIDVFDNEGYTRGIVKSQK